jgi:hypothetical protein
MVPVCDMVTDVLFDWQHGSPGWRVRGQSRWSEQRSRRYGKLAVLPGSTKTTRLTMASAEADDHKADLMMVILVLLGCKGHEDRIDFAAGILTRSVCQRTPESRS